MKLVICDLDGVVNAVSNVRKSLVPVYTDRASYWSEWHKAHAREPINPAVLEMLREYDGNGWDIIYLSSRQKTCADSTMAQIVDNGFPGRAIVLRSPLDDTPPPQYKHDAVVQLIALANVTELVAIDDCAKNLAAIGEAAKTWHVKKYTPIHLVKFVGCNS